LFFTRKRKANETNVNRGQGVIGGGGKSQRKEEVKNAGKLRKSGMTYGELKKVKKKRGKMAGVPRTRK